MRPALTLSTRRAKSSSCVLNQCEIETTRSFLTWATRTKLTKKPQLPALWFLIARSHSTATTAKKPPPPPPTTTITTTRQQTLKKFHPRYMNKDMNLEDLLQYLPTSSLNSKEIFKTLRTALYNTTQHDPKKAWLIFESMVQYDVDKYLKSNNYGQLLSMMKYDDVSRMMAILENMKRHPGQQITPESYHLSQVLFGLSKHGLVKEACDIIRFTTSNASKLGDKTLLPTPNHFHSLAIALRNNHNRNTNLIEAVTKLMLEGMERETVLLQPTFSIMLNLLSRHQQLKLQFIQSMDRIHSKNQNSNKVHPYNVYIYTSLISGFAAKGDSESAKRLFEEMRKHKIKPNDVTYGALMEAYSKAGDFTSAIRLLTVFRKKFNRVSNPMVTSLLVNAIRQNNLLVAENTVKYITDKKLSPKNMDGRLRTALIWLQTKQNLDEAREKFDELYKLDKDLVTSIMTNHLVTGYGLKQDKENVIESYRLNTKIPTTIEQQLRSKHHLTNALFHCRDVPAALTVFVSMRNQTIPDDITLAMVIQGLILNNENNLAWRLFKTLQSDGIEPNLHAYTSIIKLLGHRESDIKKRPNESTLNPDLISAAGIRLPQLDYFDSSVPAATEALSLFRHMTGFEKPNVYTYTTLISCFAKYNISRAINIFDHMCAKGVDPTVETYTAILQGCSIFRNGQTALRVFNHMCEKRIEPNAVTWRYLMKALLRSRVDKAQVDKIGVIARESLEKNKSKVD